MQLHSELRYNWIMIDKSHPLIGKRIRLTKCTDQYTSLRPGTLGTIDLIDDMGTVHVQWDNGSTLGLVPDAGDSFDIV